MFSARVCINILLGVWWRANSCLDVWRLYFTVTRMVAFGGLLLRSHQAQNKFNHTCFIMRQLYMLRLPFPR